MSMLKDKTILVTGACGTVGSELVRQLLALPDGPAEVIGIDNNESELFFLDQCWLATPNARFFVLDIRDEQDLVNKMHGVDIVFHCAALKHVVLCERSPEQAIRSNVMGTQNVINAARTCGVERVIFTSSDKAVNPTNVMGTSKLMGERVMTAANASKRAGGPVFASTRFGNVLGSSGSVVPIFHNQIRNGGPVTLTDSEMTRFVMSISQSVRLVLDSVEIARGGEVFVTKMSVVRISDLARAMIAELAPVYGHDPEAIEIVEIGTKPGEKLYEELMSDEEVRRALELEEYFAILPAFRGMYGDIDYQYYTKVSDTVDRPYLSSSEPALSEEDVRAMLKEYDLLAAPKETGQTRYWPGDRK